MRLPSSRKSAWLWLHGFVLAAPIALILPAVGAMETPLPDGIYRAERGYRHVSERCPRRVEIPEVRVSKGSISFQSGESEWSGTINAETGIVRIEATGITPRPESPLHIRGHYAKAQLFSAICGDGLFRIIR